MAIRVTGAFMGLVPLTGWRGSETVTCEVEPSLPILKGSLTATCDKRENGKSISSIGTGRASMEHGAKTHPDLACHVHPAVIIVRTRVPMTRTEARRGPRMRLPGRLGDRGGAGQRRTGPDRLEDRGRMSGCGSGPTTSIWSTGGAG
jgi:hypothetical protein